MKEKWWTFKNYFCQNISKLFKQYKYYLLVFFLIFLVCFITGILTCSEYASSISCDNLINKYLLGYLTKESSYLSFFLMLSVYFILIALFVIFFTRNSFVVIVDGVVLSLVSYVLGFDVCVVILSLGLSGVVFGIFVYGLLGILSLFFLILIISFATRRIREIKLSCDGMSRGEYVKFYSIFIMLAEVVIFIMSILLGIIHIFVIVD